MHRMGSFLLHQPGLSLERLRAALWQDDGIRRSPCCLGSLGRRVLFGKTEAQAFGHRMAPPTVHRDQVRTGEPHRSTYLVLGRDGTCSSRHCPLKDRGREMHLETPELHMETFRCPSKHRRGMSSHRLHMLPFSGGKDHV